MPITEKQRQRRKKHLGASDIPALFGVGFKTLGDVYLSKVTDLQEQTNEAMDAGNRLEHVILTWGEDYFRRKFKHNQRRVRDMIAANLDALGIDNKDEALEAKLVRWAQGWGEEGTDDIPAHVVLQCQAQMFCAGTGVVHVPTLQPNLKFKMYHVERDEDIIDELWQRAAQFWQFNVLQRTPPDDPPTLPTLLIVPRRRGKVISLPPKRDDLWSYLNAGEVAKEYKQIQEEAKRRLLTDLGDAEEAVDEETGDAVALREHSKTSIDVGKLRRDFPEVYDQVVKETTYRRFTVKKGNHDAIE